MNNETTIMDKVEMRILVDGHHGRYIPSMFIEQYADKIEPEIHVDIEQVQTLIKDLNKDNIDIDDYIELWVAIEESVNVRIDDKLYYLYTGVNGDLFGVSISDMNALSDDDREEFFQELI